MLGVGSRELGEQAESSESMGADSLESGQGSLEGELGDNGG